MTILSLDVVQTDILPYMEISVLLSMIRSNDTSSSMRLLLSLEFQRRGEEFVKWVRNLRVTNDVVETTHYSDTSRIEQSIEEGTLTRVSIVNGTTITHERKWNAEGLLISSFNYKGAQQHGLCEEWNGIGMKKISSNYEDGRLHGLYEDWNDNGVKRSSYNYKNDDRHGVYEEWSGRGVKILSKNFKDNIRHGLREYWNLKGVKISSSNYKEGVLHGLYEKWDERGVNISSSNYIDGILQ